MASSPDNAGRVATETVGSAVTAYAYDQAGRLTSMSGAKSATYTWDGADRMTYASESGAQVSYLYDPSGRMLSRSQLKEGVNTHNVFLPMGSSKETAELYGWEGEGSPATCYSYVSDPSGTRLSQTDATGTTYPFRDPRGDVLDLATPAGTLTDAYAYTPFGDLESGFTAENTPFLYQDDYRDPATELYQMQARWYDVYRTLEFPEKSRQIP